MNWFSTGFSQQDQAAKTMQEQRSRQVDRFFVTVGESKDIVFLDDTAFEYWEHNFKLNGKWGNHFTCRGKCSDTPCKFCNIKNPFFTTAFSIVDLTGYTRKDGSVVGKNVVKLLPCSLDAAKILRQIKESRPDKTLVGCQFKVARSKKNDPSVGGSFNFVQKFDLNEDRRKKFPVINYAEVLAPIDPVQMDRIVYQLQGAQASNAGQEQFGQPTAEVDYAGSQSQEEAPF